MNQRVIAIMQPTYLPWVGYLAMIERADQFVFLDNVQFNHRSWQQRNRIKTLKGEDWLTVSAIMKGRSSQRIQDVECMDLEKDIKNHLSKISHNYSKAPFFKEFYPPFSEALTRIHSICGNSLAKLNIELIKFLCHYIGIEKDFIQASKIPATGRKAELLANICSTLNGTAYLSAVGSQSYLDESDQFQRAKIPIVYHHYIHPPYSQFHGEFVVGMSCIDMIFNVPKEDLKKLIMSGCQ